MNWNRILSGVLAATYLVLAFLVAGGEGSLRIAMFLVLPLACVWFSDELGDYIGQTGSGYITERSPGILVRIMGWLLLFMPIIMVVVAVLNGSKY
jgi:hypothetical protein